MVKQSITLQLSSCPASNIRAPSALPSRHRGISHKPHNFLCLSIRNSRWVLYRVIHSGNQPLISPFTLTGLFIVGPFLPVDNGRLSLAALGCVGGTHQFPVDTQFNSCVSIVHVPSTIYDRAVFSSWEFLAQQFPSCAYFWLEAHILFAASWCSLHRIKNRNNLSKR